MPPFPSSAMDGFAARACDLSAAGRSQPVRLRIIGESRAGHPFPRRVGEGQAVAISTGAMIPEGADGVLRVEDVRRLDGYVEVSRPLRRCEDVRRAGEDLAAGALALAAGSFIGPAEIGVLASVGCAAPLCSARPRVSLLSTGDELAEVGQPLRPGMIHETNCHVLGALARGAGARLRTPERVGDDPRSTSDAIERALDRADVAIVCGGMSVGEHDHVRASLRELRVQERFFGVALRPGKPTWFGVHERISDQEIERTLVFGLPGNPLSAIVTCVLFVLPALLASVRADPGRCRSTALLASDWPKHPGRADVLPCRLEVARSGLIAHPPKAAGSNLLTSFLHSDALAILPAESARVSAGEQVEIELLRGWAGFGSGHW